MRWQIYTHKNTHSNAYTHIHSNAYTHKYSNAYTHNSNGYFPEKVFTLEASFVNTQVRLG